MIMESSGVDHICRSRFSYTSLAIVPIFFREVITMQLNGTPKNASYNITLISCGKFDKEEKADFHCPTIMKVIMDTYV